MNNEYGELVLAVDGDFSLVQSFTQTGMIYVVRNTSGSMYVELGNDLTLSVAMFAFSEFAFARQAEHEVLQGLYNRIKATTAVGREQIGDDHDLADFDLSELIFGDDKAN